MLISKLSISRFVQHWRVWPSAVAPLLAKKINVDASNLGKVLQNYIDVYLAETEEEVLTV